MPLNWDLLEIPDCLRAARSVEFTTCALLKSNELFHIFTWAVVRHTEPSTPGRFLTDRPRQLGTSPWRIAIQHGDAEAGEGLSALENDEELVLPIGERRAPMRLRPGVWSMPRFFGRVDVERPRWLPNTTEAYWLIERWCSEPSQLESPVVAAAVCEIRRTLAIDLPKARFGQIAIVVPDARVWTSANLGAGATLGVEIVRRSESAPKKFIVSARTHREGTIEYTRVHSVGDGHHVVPFPHEVDEMDVEILDAASGLPVDRHAAPIRRQFGITMDVGAGPVRVEADFLDPPFSFSVDLLLRSHSVVGTREAWEAQRRTEAGLARIEGLRRAGHLHLFLGSLGSDEEGRGSGELRGPAPDRAQRGGGHGDDARRALDRGRAGLHLPDLFIGLRARPLVISSHDRAPPRSGGAGGSAHRSR